MSDEFIVDAVRTAFEFEGVEDLMTLWNEETDSGLRQEIIKDIQGLIVTCAV